MDSIQYHSGFVAVLGRPNVGKSTLINTLMQQKIASVSPRPQTTRKRQIGILTLEAAQIIFIDTPGFHTPHNKLGERMVNDAKNTRKESDLLLLLVDCSVLPQAEDQLLMEWLSRSRLKKPSLMVLNKIDQVDPATIFQHRISYEALIPGIPIMEISAKNGDGLEILLKKIIELLPEGPHFFPENQLTESFERDLASDLIREACLYLLRDEIPHGIAVRIDQYNERGDEGAYIEATIFVERESHKGIVIGHSGNMLKQIGIKARQEIEKMSGRNVYILLKVKTKKNWRDDEKILGWLGY
jgi:GTP-binding protein Era